MCVIDGGVVPNSAAAVAEPLSLFVVSSLSEYESKVGEMRPLPPPSDAGTWYHIDVADVADDVERALSETDDDAENDDVDRALLFGE